MTRFAFVVALAGGLALAQPAAAQDSVAAEYQYINLAASGLGHHMPLGFAIEYAHDLNGVWSIVGSGDWSRDSDTIQSFRLEPFLEPVAIDASLTQLTFAAGPRWNRTDAEGAGFYGQLLAGVTRTTTSSAVDGVSDSDHATDFTIQPGVGFALPFGETWRFVGGLDYRRVFSEGDRDIGLRLYAGIRKNFKK